MDWNSNMDEAPRNGTKIIHIGKQQTPHVIYTKNPLFGLSSIGEVVLTYWIPQQRRWSGFTEENPPVAWCAVPEHPLIAERWLKSEIKIDG